MRVCIFIADTLRNFHMDEIANKSGARPYHHGDLRAALIAAAEEILERDGIQALTLRAAARAVGVSHAAPAHHFGDLTGLLSDLAAVGYARFVGELSQAMAAAGGDAKARMKAMGRAYVHFAQAYPGMFMLMFRSERLDATRPSLHEALKTSRETLRDGIVARAGGAPLSQSRVIAEVAASWSIVHGFAVLLLDGRLQTMISAMPEGADADTLLDAVFAVSGMEA
jgi:AcrR family transcriptional regulator